MLSLPPNIREMLTLRSRRLAPLWDITRTDGVVLRFTGHDSPLTMGGNTYKSAWGFEGSARRFQDALKDSTVDFRGVISSPDISDTDLRAGKYRDAEVRETLVDWRWPYRGGVSNYFWVEQTTFDKEVWVGELSGPQRFLKRAFGQTLDRNCERKLGDAECTVDLNSFTIVGVSVLGMEDGDKRLVIYADPATLSAFTDEYFAFGELTFTTGANTGILPIDIKKYRASDRRIELQVPLPYPVANGDLFTIIAGCDRRFTTCVSKFSNGINYGGFLFLPGTDKVLKGPSARQ